MPMKILTTDTFNKKSTFLIDGIGALISGLSLYFVIGSFESLFGMPSTFVKKLAILPFLYCIYSLSCHQIKPKSGKFLKIIALLNLVYCLISITSVIIYADVIKPLGFMYFAMEKLIVIPLAVWEWKLGDQ